MTLPIGIGWAMSMIPPCWIFGIRSVELDVWRGLVCRLAMLSPSTTTLTPPAVEPRRYMLRPPGAGSRRMTRSTLPRLAGVLAGEHDDGVALADLGHLRPGSRPDGHHSTSGASETIFM